MKYIVVGLGKLGKAMAESLTSFGHEVIGLDQDMREVDAVKNTISLAIRMDARDENAVKSLPLKDSDAVYITYGEDFGLSVHTAAVFKKLKAKRIVVRATSPLHETVLRAIGVDEILSPEIDYSHEFVATLQLGNKLDHWYKVTSSHHLVKVKIPVSMVGYPIQSVDFMSDFNLKLLAVLRPSIKKNIIGQADKREDVLEDITEDTLFEENDKLLLFGKPSDYNKLEGV